MKLLQDYTVTISPTCKIPILSSMGICVLLQEAGLHKLTHGSVINTHFDGLLWVPYLWKYNKLFCLNSQQQAGKCFLSRGCFVVQIGLCALCHLIVKTLLHFIVGTAYTRQAHFNNLKMYNSGPLLALTHCAPTSHWPELQSCRKQLTLCWLEPVFLLLDLMTSLKSTFFPMRQV